MSRLAMGLLVSFSESWFGAETEVLMSFGIYLAGFIVLIIGLALGAHMLHVSDRWIGVGVLVLIGLGIVKGVASTRQRDPL
jgi:hypothetical protein